MICVPDLFHKPSLNFSDVYHQLLRDMDGPSWEVVNGHCPEVPQFCSSHVQPGYNGIASIAPERHNVGATFFLCFPKTTTLRSIPLQLPQPHVASRLVPFVILYASRSLPVSVALRRFPKSGIQKLDPLAPPMIWQERVVWDSRIAFKPTRQVDSWGPSFAYLCC